MEFGTRLKALRTKKNLTANQVAKQAGVPVSSYQEWEQGRRIRDIEVYVKLAQVLEIPFAELVWGQKNSQQNAEIQAALAQIDRAMELLKNSKARLVSVKF